MHIIQQTLQMEANISQPVITPVLDDESLKPNAATIKEPVTSNETANVAAKRSSAMAGQWLTLESIPQSDSFTQRLLSSAAYEFHE